MIVSLRRRKSSEYVKQFRSEHTDELRQLARKIARWSADNKDAIGAHEPGTGSLFNRAADNWRPLLAIADLAGGDWAAALAPLPKLRKERSRINPFALCC